MKIMVKNSPVRGVFCINKSLMVKILSDKI